MCYSGVLCNYVPSDNGADASAWSCNDFGIQVMIVKLDISEKKKQFRVTNSDYPVCDRLGLFYFFWVTLKNYLVLQRVRIV